MSVRKLCACTRIAALLLAAAAFESAAAQATSTTTAAARRQQSPRATTPAEPVQAKARIDSIVRASADSNRPWVDSAASNVGTDSTHVHGADSIAAARAAARAARDSARASVTSPAAAPLTPADPGGHDHQQAVDSMSGTRGGSRAPDTASTLPLLVIGGITGVGAGLLLLRRARA